MQLNAQKHFITDTLEKISAWAQHFEDGEVSIYGPNHSVGEAPTLTFSGASHAVAFAQGIEFMLAHFNCSTKPIRCNGCMSQLEERDLIRFQKIGEDAQDACPKCLTDENLMDIVPESIQRLADNPQIKAVRQGEAENLTIFTGQPEAIDNAFNEAINKLASDAERLDDEAANDAAYMSADIAAVRPLAVAAPRLLAALRELLETPHMETARRNARAVIAEFDDK